MLDLANGFFECKLKPDEFLAVCPRQLVVDLAMAMANIVPTRTERLRKLAAALP